jgi:hypothetical protein
MRRGARVLAGLAAASLTAGVVSVVGGAAGAQESTGLGGFSTLARATGIRVFYDSEISPSPYPPLFEGTLPEALAVYEAGVGRAFSSMAWPGPLLGNLGTLIPLLITQENPITDLAKQLNYPIRAEAATGTNREQTFDLGPGSGMVAHADEKLVFADGTFMGFRTPEVLAVGGITTHSSNEVLADSVVASALSAIEDIAIGPANLITIESIKTTAKVISDGVDAKTESNTVIAGVKVAGLPAKIDEDGITIASQVLGPLLAPVVEQANKALEALGIQIYLTPIETVDAENDPFASVTASGLIITLDGELPQIDSRIPLAGKQHIMLQFAGATVSAAASGAFLDEEPTGGLVDDVVDGLGGGVPIGDLPTDSGSPIDLGPVDLGSPPVDTGGSGAPSPSSGAGGGATELIGYSGVPIGLFVLALIGALFVGGWLRRLPDRVLVAAGTTCDQDK